MSDKTPLVVDYTFNVPLTDTLEMSIVEHCIEDEQGTASVQIKRVRANYGVIHTFDLSIDELDALRYGIDVLTNELRQ